jgi:transposase-like protein
MGRIRRFFCNHDYLPSVVMTEGARYRCSRCGNEFFVKQGYSIGTGSGDRYEADGTFRKRL